jgi:hypothetical protein
VLIQGGSPGSKDSYDYSKKSWVRRVKQKWFSGIRRQEGRILGTYHANFPKSHQK